MTSGQQLFFYRNTTMWACTVNHVIITEHGATLLAFVEIINVIVTTVFTFPTLTHFHDLLQLFSQ